MAARSIASLSLTFGLVSIPVKLYSATESAASVRFNLLDKDGSRVRQQYVSEKDQHVVPRSEMVKGYEFEKDRYVLFEPEELKALEEGTNHTIDIVAFIPEKAVDPIYYDKAYFLAPDKRGAKPYTLLREAMQKSGRCALAKWAWKGKQYVVQVRAADDGLVLQQLLYAEEVRSLADLDIEKVKVSDAELKLALQLIDQISEDDYDPAAFEDEEKQRILAAIDAKIAGKQVVATEQPEPRGGEVIDLMESLRASLAQRGGSERAPAESAGKARKSPAKATAKATAGKAADKATEKAAGKAAEKAAEQATDQSAEQALEKPARKPARRAARPAEAAEPVRARARK